ncbi:MAG: polysaccharide deacetylase family protein, partial [Actinomycetota bacterium]|nr:polysaccharide deacetylase family protein [Actinomycetota bacterium]
LPCQVPVPRVRALPAVLAVALTAGALAPVAAQPAQAVETTTPRMQVVAPLYESPGGTVPVLVTVHQPPRGAAVTLSATADGGASVTCTALTWTNPVRRSTTRKCYLTTPRRAGTYRITGTARLTAPDRPALVVSGTRTIQADGVPTAPISLAAAQAIERCHRTTTRVRLTFDDAFQSSADFTSIRATLKRNRVRATFFGVRGWATATQAAALLADGHDVQNHTREHLALSRVSDTEVRRQIAGGAQPSRTPKLLRPPYGAGALTTRLHDLAAAQGYRLCRWTADTSDWNNTSPAVMVEKIRYGDATTPPLRAGGNLLMHMGGEQTPEALPRVIDAIRAKGLVLDPLP